ncbi:TPA: hypothetical protein ACHR2W_002801 [Listeria monocytogenes]
MSPQEKNEAIKVENEIRRLKKQAIEIAVNNLKKYIKSGDSAMVAAIAEILK